MYHKNMSMIGRRQKGFTIVELLVVIVVIGILAAITIVAYNGIQQRGRDAQRQSDVSSIAKALELYYLDKGFYPVSSCTSNCSINDGWSSTADGSWQNLVNQLVPEYVSSMPKDPISKPTAPGVWPWNVADGYDYSYASVTNYCRATPTTTRQTYILVYKYEVTSQKQTSVGDCTVNQLAYNASWYRVSK